MPWKYKYKHKYKLIEATVLAKTAPDRAIQIQMIWLFKEIQSIGATLIVKTAPDTCPVLAQIQI